MNKVMKTNRAPEKIYMSPAEVLYKGDKQNDNDIEYTRTDAFINKAREWFEQQPETYDANGVRVYGEEDFEDFVNHMKGE